MHSGSTSAGSTSQQPPTLQMQVEKLSTLPLQDIIQCLARLLPVLTTSVSPTGDRLVSHPTYRGTSNLDDLGRLYLQAADRCTRERASFQTRLLHVSLDAMIESLYVSSEEQLKNGIEDGTVTLPPSTETGCPCCKGEPYAVILAGFHEEEALLFWEDEYKLFWGDEPNHGGRYGGGETWLRASKEQVERALAQQEAAKVPPAML